MNSRNADQPKNQHWLPCVYLKEFSPDFCRGRKSEVWRFDGSRSLFVPVDSQCNDKCFYTAASAKEAESYFGQIENLYGGCLKKIRAGANQEPTFQEYFGLILMVFDLCLRNKSHQNLTGQNNLGAYRTRLFCFLRDMVLGKSDGIPTEKELKSHLHKHWRVRIIAPTSNSELITSDNPTMLFTTNDRRDCHFAILPVTPFHIAVAFDERFVQILSDRTTHADDGILNKNQCRQAVSAVYSRTRLDVEQERSAASLLKEPRNHGLVSQSAVELAVLGMTAESTLSFIRVSACV